MSEATGATLAAAAGGTTPQAGDGQGTAAPQPQTWVETLPEDARGYVQNKGWKEPANMLDSYRALEKTIGVPPEHLVRLPKDDTPEAWNEVYAKLGRPADPSGYKLEFDAEDSSYAEFFTKTLHENGLTQKQAEGLLKAFAGQSAAEAESAAADLAARRQEDQTALLKEWGAAHDRKMAEARNAAREFGVEQPVVEALENQLGLKKTMEFFAKIGSKLGEASFVEGGAGSFSGAPTPAQAQAQLGELYGDKGFQEAFYNQDHPGHKAAVEKKSRLTRLAYPG